MLSSVWYQSILDLDKHTVSADQMIYGVQFHSGNGSEGSLKLPNTKGLNRYPDLKYVSNTSLLDEKNELNDASVRGSFHLSACLAAINERNTVE